MSSETMTETQTDPFMDALGAEVDRSLSELAICGMDPLESEIASLCKSIQYRKRDIADVKAFCAKRVEQLTKQIAWLQTGRAATLSQAVRHRLAGRKEKSINTPYGRFGFRHRAASVSWEKEDAKQVLAWAKENIPHAVRASMPMPIESVGKTEIIAAIEAGERIPGTVYVAAGDEFYVKVAKEQDNGSAGD